MIVDLRHVVWCVYYQGNIWPSFFETISLHFDSLSLSRGVWQRLGGWDTETTTHTSAHKHPFFCRLKSCGLNQVGAVWTLQLLIKSCSNLLNMKVRLHGTRVWQVSTEIRHNNDGDKDITTGVFLHGWNHTTEEGLVQTYYRHQNVFLNIFIDGL